MNKPRNIELNNMKVKYNNLGGKPNDWGNVVLDVSFELTEDMAKQLKADGWHINEYTPKYDDAEPIHLLKGIISFRDKKGNLKERNLRPDIYLCMEGEKKVRPLSESMIISYFGKNRLEILYADEVKINAAPRKDGDGCTAYINSMVLVCRNKSKYEVSGDTEDYEYENDDIPDEVPFN